jgi:hypothetical protein
MVKRGVSIPIASKIYHFFIVRTYKIFLSGYIETYSKIYITNLLCNRIAEVRILPNCYLVPTDHSSPSALLGYL